MSEFIINKIKGSSVSHILAHMKDHGGCYVAGGAISSLASGRHDQIEDWDIYFPTLEAVVEAIRYMKEDNPHVAFVSDKSITYVLKDSTKVQFVYTDFYPTAEDIFKHFDFYCVMGAYDCRDESLYFHKDFWLHNAQRYLGVNTGTLYPIISLLRINRYESKGYHTSRKEYLKLGLACAKLNITTWEEAAAQLGNTYGLDLGNLTHKEDEPFTLDALMDRLEDSYHFTGKGLDIIPMQSDYLYPHDAVDFALLGKSGVPVEYMIINEEKVFLDGYAAEVADSIDDLVEDGVVTLQEVDKDLFLKRKFYAIVDSDQYKEGMIANISSYWGLTVYSKEGVAKSVFANSEFNSYLVEVTFTEDQIKSITNFDCLYVTGVESAEVICRKCDVMKWLKGDAVEMKHKVTSMEKSSTSPRGWAYTTTEQFEQGKLAQLKELRGEHIKAHAYVTKSDVKYAKHTYTGVILQGGEDIKAHELLAHLDDYNLSFGGECTIETSGKFYATVFTD